MRSGRAPSTIIRPSSVAALRDTAALAARGGLLASGRRQGRVGLPGTGGPQTRRAVARYRQGRDPAQCSHQTRCAERGRMALMKMHPCFGFALISSIGGLAAEGDVVDCHHERMDGTGYPRGLAMDRIPLNARIFAVADALDAIVRTDAIAKAVPSGRRARNWRGRRERIWTAPLSTCCSASPMPNWRPCRRGIRTTSGALRREPRTRSRNRWRPSAGCRGLRADPQLNPPLESAVVRRLQTPSSMNRFTFSIRRVYAMGFVS